MRVTTLPGCAALAIGAAAILASSARADGVADDEVLRYRSSALAIDAGFVAAAPAALPTGMSRGVGVGVTSGRGLTWGARASWTTATETTIGWDVTHDDIR